MRQYETLELCFSGPEPEASWVEVNLEAEFQCDGEITRVKGFYAGAGKYIIRHYLRKPGKCRWKVMGMFQEQGELVCEASHKGHGIVRAEKNHFVYEDGSRYLPFGTTVYAMIHQEESLVNETMETLSHSPFNKVRFCIFPKSYEYNHNEPTIFPFMKKDSRWDVHHPNPEFWDGLEKVIRTLGDMGIEADLILFHPYDRWGFAKFTKEECMVYLDYLVRRLSAFPNIWWCLANEYDLMQNFKQEWWKEFAAYLHANDGNRHCLSNHNFVRYWDFADTCTTHCCVQNDCMTDARMLFRKYQKPVIFEECGYEGNIPETWGNISAFELVNRYWTACTLGGYCTHGETYLDEKEILWWGKGGKLHGESAPRIAFLKEILYSLPGFLACRMEPLEAFLIDFLAEDLDVLEKKAQTDEAIKAFLEWPRETVERLEKKGKEISGAVDEKVFLVYFGRQCAKKGKIVLPTDGGYRVEIIDVWEMTREKVKDNVNGEVWVELPGKEGVALLAQRNEESAVWV